MVTVAQVSFRLMGTDGVSVESAKWAEALRELGCRVVTVAGDGPVDRRVRGLAWGAAGGPAPGSVEAALEDADVVVVENLCSLPLNPVAGAVVADVLRGRPAVLHHFDLPWQRARFASFDGPPDDPAWAHVCINRLSARELAARRGVHAEVIYNAFDVDVPEVPRAEARRALGWPSPDDGLLVLQPTRAIERKNIGVGVALAEALGASYWLTGPAEEGYKPPLEGASVPVRWERCDDMALAYAACNVVAFPSSIEGFGNPVLESAVHRRPLAVLGYSVLDELAEFGFQWLRADEPDDVRRFLAAPARRQSDFLAANWEAARDHFSLADLPGKLAALFERQGWGL